MRLLSDFLFLGIFFLVLIIWFISWALMHVASGGIHLLLVVAAISLLFHVLRGRRAT